MNNGFVVAVTTVGGREEARKMARAMVARKLAACAQISETESFYEWEGEVQNEREFRVLFKTSAAHCEELKAAVCESHPYDLPAFFAVAAESAHKPFAEWVCKNSPGEKQ